MRFLLNSVWFLLLPYIVLSIFNGYLARNRAIGKTKATLISFTLTPLVGIIFVFFSPYRNPFDDVKVTYKCQKCGWAYPKKFDNCPNCDAKFEEQ